MIEEVYNQNFLNNYALYTINYGEDTGSGFAQTYGLSNPLEVVMVDVAGGEVPDHHRNQQRRDLPRSAFDEQLVLFAHRVQAADAAGNDHTDPVRVDVAAAQLFREPRAIHRLVAGRDGILAEEIQPFGLFRRHIFGDVKIFDLTGNLRAVFRRIKAGDPAQAAPAVDQGIPEIRYIVADAGHHAVTGNHYPSIVHTYFILHIPARTPYLQPLLHPCRNGEAGGFSS